MYYIKLLLREMESLLFSQWLHGTVVWKIFVDKYFVSEEVRVKNISWLLLSDKILLTTK